MHGRAVAEVMIGIVDVCFLARSALMRDWSWLRATWIRIADRVLALADDILVARRRRRRHAGIPAGRRLRAVLMLPAALGYAVLSDARMRRWLQGVLTARALYIGCRPCCSSPSGATSRDSARNGDGELTGPFQHPRAAAPLSRLLFPVLLPPRRGPAARGAAASPALGAAALTRGASR